MKLITSSLKSFWICVFFASLLGSVLGTTLMLSGFVALSSYFQSQDIAPELN